MGGKGTSKALWNAAACDIGIGGLVLRGGVIGGLLSGAESTKGKFDMVGVVEVEVGDMEGEEEIGDADTQLRLSIDSTGDEGISVRTGGGRRIERSRKLVGDDGGMSSLIEGA